MNKVIRVSLRLLGEILVFAGFFVAITAAKRLSALYID